MSEKQADFILNLSTLQVNLILRGLSKLTIEEAGEAFSYIKQECDRQYAEQQQQAGRAD